MSQVLRLWPLATTVASEENSDGTHDIIEGADKNKDQSYFLALLRQEQVRRALFPIGEIAKPEVRNIARKWVFAIADKKDSQGICFLGKVDINEFLRARIPDNPGEIINHAGHIVGEHRGLHHYTISQREGIGVLRTPITKHMLLFIGCRKISYSLRLMILMPLSTYVVLY